MNLTHEVARLFFSRLRGVEEMIGSTDEVVFSGLIKIIIKIGINEVAPLCSFNNHKTQWHFFNLCVAQQDPIYFSLIVRNVNSMNRKL